MTGADRRVGFVLLAVVWLWVTVPVAADGLDHVHHELEIRLEPETRRLEAVDRIQIRGGGTVEFALAQGFAPSRIEVNGTAIDPGTGRAGSWRIPLDGAGSHSVRIDYAGRLAPLDPEARRSGAVSDAAGSYLPAGTGWFPSVDAQRLSYRVTVTVPAAYRAVATGNLADETVEAGDYRAVYTADPAVEEPSLFAGPWQMRERRDDGLRLRTYLEPDLADLAEDYLALSAETIARFSERIGPYPFDNFSILSAPLPVGLGFPALTYIGRQVLPLPFIRTQSLPHEILHNWWGNGVLVDYARGNWAEGLTTYMADYGLTAERGAEAAREMRLGWLRDYAALPAERDERLDRFTAKLHGAAQVIGYNKAAFVFLMLEDRLGRERFEAGVRLFWERHEFAVASWADLRMAFEEASGEDLAAFFEQWLTRAGAPELHLDEVSGREDENGHAVTLTISQEAPAYALRVPVVIDTVEGPVGRVVDLSGRSVRVTLPVPAEPSQVAVDPDYRLFRRLAPGEAPPILRDITLNPATGVVLAAADRQTAATARTLAERLMDAGGRVVSAEAARASSAPLAVIGTTTEVGRTLAGLGLPPAPDALAGRGTARVWTQRLPEGRAVLAVAADDASALEALLRPLPHYGRQSFLVFDGRQAIERGVWPAGDSPLSREVR